MPESLRQDGQDTRDRERSARSARKSGCRTGSSTICLVSIPPALATHARGTVTLYRAAIRGWIASSILRPI